MKRIVLFLFLISASNSSFSQLNSTSIGKIFILRLSQDKILEYDNNVVNIFKVLDSLEMDVDTLKMYDLFNTFKFFKFELGKNKIRQIGKLNISFNSSFCKNYILAVNTKSGESFRIQGFKGNDLLFFLRELQPFLPSKSTSQDALNFLISISSEINIKCIYNATISMNFECPCIKPCSDGIPSHNNKGKKICK